MNDDAGPVLTFTGRAWALLRDRGNLGPDLSMAYDRAGDGMSVCWRLLDAVDQRDLYRALVRATARCHDRPDRLWFADVLHRLGNELTPLDPRTQ